MVCLTDLLATLAEIAGVPLPRWAGEDSFSMRSAWLGGTGPIRDHLLLQSYTGVLAIREGRWKLILGTEGSGGHQGVTPGWMPNQGGWIKSARSPSASFDLETDPYEQTNLFDQQPEIVAKLRERLQQLVHEDRSRN